MIFVVDSSDRERVSEARDELQALLKDEELRDAVVLIFANKQDLPGAMDAAEVAHNLGLHDVRHHGWFIQTACANTGEGLNQGNLQLGP